MSRSTIFFLKRFIALIRIMYGFLLVLRDVVGPNYLVFGPKRRIRLNQKLSRFRIGEVSVEICMISCLRNKKV